MHVTALSDNQLNIYNMLISTNACLQAVKISLFWVQFTSTCKYGEIDNQFLSC